MSMLDKEQCIWTIGIVNYKSAVYIKWQLKIFYEYNDPSIFKIVIVDNSNPHEKQLSDLIAPYSKYNNIETIYYTPEAKCASGQHGEGIELIKHRLDTKYFLVQDPDFFWVQKNFLNTLAAYLKAGYVAIGAPSLNKVGIGDRWFPTAFGCAYISNEIKNITFLGDVAKEKRQESLVKFPPSEGYEFSYDVGWQVRAKLSDKLHLSFKQKDVIDLKQMIGIHSFETITKEYLLENKTIAFHLFRGTFTGLFTDDYKDPQQAITDKVYNIRDQYGEFFYNFPSNYKKIKIYRFYYKISVLLADLLEHLQIVTVRNIKKFRLGRVFLSCLKKIFKQFLKSQ